MSLSDLQDAKEQVRQSIDIVDLSGSYMTLRRQGRGYVAVCPWHDDTRPSLQINPERQSFKCWVCDIGGDIFSFLMRMEGVEFREALEMLADRAGIELAPKRAIAGQGSEFEKRNLYSALAWAEQQFHDCLLNAPEADVARRYLEARGIEKETTRLFQLGFAPPSWDWLLSRSTEFSPAVLERVGLVAKRQSGSGFYDRFRGRLMFSIRDTRSRPIAFGGRVIPGLEEKDPHRQEAKYINSPETPLFSKSSELYALDLAKDSISKQQGIVVMEGYTDVLMAHQHGITNAVAVLGTALNEKHIPVLRRFTDSITLVLDGDDAGQNRTMQILDDLLALFVNFEIDLRILTLPKGADPCDVIASQGRESFQHLLSTSVDALEHKIAVVTKGLATASGTHATSQAVEQILGTLVHAFPTEGLETSSALVREQQIMSRLARQFGISEEMMRTRLIAKRREVSRRRRPVLNTTTQNIRSESKAQVSALERELFELTLHHPEVIPQLVDNISPDSLQNSLSRVLFEKVVAMFQGGRPVSFEQLMLEFEDESLKSLLVLCDEVGREKTESDTKQRVQDLLALVAKQQQESWHQSQIAELKQSHMDPEHEKELLAELFTQMKGRQAGSSPTEG